MSATAAEVAALYAAAIKQTAEQCKLAPLFSHAEPIAGDYTFHTIMIIVSAIATILTIIFSLGLSLYHMFNFVVSLVLPTVEGQTVTNLDPRILANRSRLFGSFS